MIPDWVAKRDSAIIQYLERYCGEGNHLPFHIYLFKRKIAANKKTKARNRVQRYCRYCGPRSNFGFIEDARGARFYIHKNKYCIKRQSNV